MLRMLCIRCNLWSFLQQWHCVFSSGSSYFCVILFSFSDIDIRRNICCEPCENPVTGGFDSEYNQVVVCQNNARSRGVVQGVLAHELMHMFDYCRANMDFKNMDHLACTEVGPRLPKRDLISMRQERQWQTSWSLAKAALAVPEFIVSIGCWRSSYSTAHSNFCYNFLWFSVDLKPYMSVVKCNITEIKSTLTAGCKIFITKRYIRRPFFLAFWKLLKPMWIDCLLSQFSTPLFCSCILQASCSAPVICSRGYLLMCACHTGPVGGDSNHCSYKWMYLHVETCPNEVDAIAEMFSPPSFIINERR